MRVRFDIDSYKAKFSEGMKQYLFFAFFTFPWLSTIKYPEDKNWVSSLLEPLGYGSKTNTVPYLVRSTSIPDSSFEEISIPYPGIPYKMAGTRSFGDWQVSFNLDADGVLLNNFHIWHDVIYNNDHSSTSPKTYMANQQLFLIDGNGDATHTFQLVKAWPKSIGAVGLDYSSSDIATMDVTFSYQYFKLDNTISNTKKDLLSSAFNRLMGSAPSIFQ